MSPYFSALITYMFLLVLFTGSFDDRDGFNVIFLPLIGAALAYIVAARAKRSSLEG